MKRLYSKEGDTLDDVFRDNEYEIYNQVLQSIKENYKGPADQEIKVISISTKDIDYSISLNQEKFIPSLNKCIKFFEVIEEYEKCQDCLDIIKELKKNKHEIEYGIN